ncbi:MAG TPA: hypothetical protein VIK91_19740 [Nannocystis sp.]
MASGDQDSLSERLAARRAQFRADVDAARRQASAPRPARARQEPSAAATAVYGLVGIVLFLVLVGLVIAYVL